MERKAQLFAKVHTTETCEKTYQHERDTNKVTLNWFFFLEML